MKPKDSSPASSRSGITTKGNYVQTCIITCWGNLRNQLLARAAVAAVGAFGIFLTAGAGDTNSAPVPCALSTNAPSFFCAYNGTGAVYYKYDTNGVFTVIMKEHVGVWPAYSGRWVQASNGIVTRTATTPPQQLLVCALRQWFRRATSRASFLSGLKKSTRETQKGYVAESILEQTHGPLPTSS